MDMVEINDDSIDKYQLLFVFNPIITVKYDPLVPLSTYKNNSSIDLTINLEHCKIPFNLYFRVYRSRWK